MIAGQLETINRLKQDNNLLQIKLQALRSGCSATDFYPPFAVEDSEFLSLHHTFTSLKNKISACRLLGPCGLTVLNVQSKSLVVSFTSVWKDLTQSYVLHIADSNDRVKVAGTTIPYFIDVGSIISGKEDLDWSKVMDKIGYHINAYTQRCWEVEHVQSNHKTVLEQISFNDPMTVVEMDLALPVNSSNTLLRVKLHLVCDNIENVIFNKVSVTSSHPVPSEKASEMKRLLKSKPLSKALPAFIERLTRVSIDEDEREEI